MLRKSRWLYQAADHMPPWAMEYEWEFTGKRLHLYCTLYSEQVASGWSFYFEVSGQTPFSLASQIVQIAKMHGVYMNDEDFNQIDWHFAKYF